MDRGIGTGMTLGKAALYLPKYIYKYKIAEKYR